MQIETPDYKNIVYGNTINTEGNIHIGDNIYMIDRDLRQSILFFRIERSPLPSEALAQKETIFKGQLSIRSDQSTVAATPSSGTPLLYEWETFCVPEKLFHQLETFQATRRSLDVTYRATSQSMPEWLRVEEERLTHELFDLFFSGDIGKVCKDFIDLLEKNKIGELLLLLSSEDVDMMNIPWEMTLPRFFLVKNEKENKQIGVNNFSLVRTTENTLSGFDIHSSKPAPAPLKMLFVTAMPEDMAEKEKLLEVEDEQRKIIEAVGRLEATGLDRPRMAIEFLDNASLESIDQALSKGAHNIVHISGHGAYLSDLQNGLLFLEDEIGNERPATGAELGAVLRTHKKNIQLLILSACETAVAGSNGGVVQQLAQYGIPAVVCMRFAISDQAAKQFTTVLYDHLSKGSTIIHAFHYARTALWQDIQILRQLKPEASLIAEWFTPVLYLNQRTGALLDTERDYFLPPHFQPKSTFLKTRTTRLVGDGFIGRKKYLIKLRRALDAGQHICLHGLGGMGKTTLAEAFAHNYDKRSHSVIIFRHGAQINEKYILDELLARFEDVQSDASLLRHIKFQLNHSDINTKPIDKLQVLLDNYLTGRKTILLFDNFEDVQRSNETNGSLKCEIESEGLSDFLSYFCQNAPDNCHLLFTSRYQIVDLEDEVTHLPLDQLSYAEQYRLIGFSATLSQLDFKERQQVFKRFQGHPRAYEFLESLLANDQKLKWPTLADRLDKVEEEVYESLLLQEVYIRLTAEVQEIFQMASVFITRTSLAVLIAVSEKEEVYLVGILKVLQAWSICYWDEEAREFEVHQLTRNWAMNHIYEPGSDLLQIFSEKAGRYYIDTMEEEKHLELSVSYFRNAAAWEQFAKYATVLADMYSEAGVYDKALALILEVVERNISLKYTVRGLKVLGKMAVMVSDYDNALFHFKTSLALLMDAGEKEEIPGILKNISTTYNYMNDYESALKYAQRGLMIAKENKDRGQECNLLRSIGYTYSDIGDMDTALRYLNEAIAMQDETDDEDGQLSSWSLLGHIYFTRGKYKEALKFFEQALNGFVESGTKVNIAKTLNNISQIYHDKGDLDKALAYLFESIKIREEIGDKNGLGRTLNNISQIFSDRGDNTTAIAYLNQALSIQKSIRDLEGESITLSNIGSIYLDRKEYNEALSYFGESLKITIKIGDKIGEATRLNNMGQTFRALEQTNDAQLCFLRCASLQEEAGDYRNLGITLYNLGSMLAETLNFEAAVAPLVQSVKILSEIESPIASHPREYLMAMVQILGVSKFQEIASGIDGVEISFTSE